MSCVVALFACTSNAPGTGENATGGAPPSGGAPAPPTGSMAVGGALSGGGAGAPSPGDAGSTAAAGVAGIGGSADPWHDNCPQAGGPEGTWRIAGTAPKSFSVALDQNILIADLGPLGETWS
jgi:hypothetical protein